MKRKFCLWSLILLCLLFVSYTSNAQVGGLYNAQGWAASTPGGQGGNIIRVTNLNASGSGSFTDALRASGARIIVFEVGGVINLQGSNISISNPYITIAGQTAPSPGITVVNGTISIRTHDVIMQHMSVRPGATGHETGWEPDGPSCVSAHHVIIDHCSMSWAVDENCSASGPRFDGNTPDEWRLKTSHDITISNNIIAEGLNYATHSKGLHSMGSLIHDNVSNVAIIRNLYSCNNQRNPLFKAGAMGAVVNNYIYNPGSSGVRYALVKSEWEGYEWVKGRMSVVGNYMQLGPSSKAIAFMVATNSPCELYMDDNIAIDQTGKNVQQYQGDAANIVLSKPIWNNNMEILPASKVTNQVIIGAGARPWDRDEIDQRMINDVLNNTGRMINFESEAGGFPNYEQSNAPFNVDQWNLDYMIRETPEIEVLLPANSDTIYTDSLYQISVNIIAPEIQPNFVELVINGVQYGKKTVPPYTWEFKSDSVGDFQIVAITETPNMNLLASPVSVAHVKRMSTGTGIPPKADPLDVIPLIIYPNPFYGQTTIDYFLSEENNVNLSILNSKGQQVYAFYDQKVLPGRNQILWNTNCLAKGPYFIVLILGSKVFCRKIIHGE